MAAKSPVTRFQLGPDSPQLPAMDSPSLTKNPQAQKEKMNMFKRHLAANRARSDEAIRKKMELLKAQRSASNVTKSSIQKDMEADAKSRVEQELGRPMSTKDWPFVYFVVTLDQMPHLADDGNALGDNSKSSQTARERQRFLVSRRRKIQETREENERIREAGIDMGLRLEPIKPSVPPTTQETHREHTHRARNRPSLSRHPTTPVSSVCSKPAEFSVLNQDDLSEVELTRRSIGLLINDTLSQVGLMGKGGGGHSSEDHAPAMNASGSGATSGPKTCPISNIELPEISANTRRRALGTSLAIGAARAGQSSDRKTVTFAEGLPIIKGNGISVTPTRTNLDAAPVPSTHHSTPVYARPDPSASQEVVPQSRVRLADEYVQPPWSAPLTTRSMTSLSSKSKLYTPMALPKIDIVSEIYDELIVKTIQNYLVAEGYSQEKFHQLRQTVLARLSATYPHLVKHKAWRQGQWVGGDHEGGVDEDTDRTAADQIPDKLKVSRSRSQHPRYGRLSSGGQGQSSEFSHNLRPFTCPYMTLQKDSEKYSQSPDVQSPFMAVDGRTMTITPRDEQRFRFIASAPKPSNATATRLAIMEEEDKRESEEEEETERTNEEREDGEKEEKEDVEREGSSDELVERQKEESFVIPREEESDDSYDD